MSATHEEAMAAAADALSDVHDMDVPWLAYAEAAVTAYLASRDMVLMPRTLTAEMRIVLEDGPLEYSDGVDEVCLKTNNVIAYVPGVWEKLVEFCEKAPTE